MTPNLSQQEIGALSSIDGPVHQAGYALRLGYHTEVPPKLDLFLL